jgi:hypothetical protein
MIGREIPLRRKCILMIGSERATLALEKTAITSINHK